ncbi:hypothetical protein Sru01_23400 [Sphaerisporangium rufum]|uniref:Gluconeogenesis factor n=1 Tax=Sphaerisporangium rufum TaxID=1381558 RepID=A0A919R104_9ACTN|nr:2-phospho-L-lactate transferase CofD family protein [Sphaerisporangium rufum]GII77358.1 hypothetical protein Sru01_23400 [Sphaerisporangium rufum]
MIAAGTAAVAMFGGGRGAASIARRLLRTPGVDLTLLINGYDDGMSTGALRRYLPGMLGPSDFRKNLRLHLDPGDPRQAALAAVLDHRLPAGTGRAGLRGLIEAIDGGPGDARPAAFAGLDARAREAIGRELRVFARRLAAAPGGLDLADCALGNLLIAGAYLRLGEDFNAAIGSCARTFGSPVHLLNVTGGEDAHLVAVKRDGRILADEASIVAPQDAVPISDLYLLGERLGPATLAALSGRPAGRVRAALDGLRAEITPNPRALRALLDADLIVYGPGTPHSSLLPSYLTPGIAEAIAASRAAAKVFVVNVRDDHDAQGLSAPALVGRTLHHLGDPGNERRTVTHVLCHRPAVPAASGTRMPEVPRIVLDHGEWSGARWLIADLEDPGTPGVHCGRRTVEALAGVGAGIPAGAAPAVAE